MTQRLSISKTYKLFIGGKFPRTESGRSVKIADSRGAVVAHTCRASRKDLRNAVEAAAKAQASWASATAYLRGQILYRLAEMMEGKAAELADALNIPIPSEKHDDSAIEVAASIDRVIHYAGWTDKYAQVLGCANPVAGPYHNFTIPDPVGVVGVVCPDELPLLALISLVMPAVCAGNACVVLASETNPIPACVLAEAMATSDLPAGVVNILTGYRDELVEHMAMHREIAAIHASGMNQSQRKTLELGAAENLKRVTVRGSIDFFDNDVCESAQWIESCVEYKTIWHPSSA